MNPSDPRHMGLWRARKRDSLPLSDADYIKDPGAIVPNVNALAATC